MLSRSCRLLQELQVLLSKLSSAAECCPSAAECCPEVAGCYRSCRSHVCAALEDGAGHMYVLLGVEKLSSNCKCCPGENKCAAQLWGDKEWDKKNKIKEMDKLLNFRDDPTTKIKTAISFCMYL
jgi:hypothetical protein